MTWRWIVAEGASSIPPAWSGARNMAIDAALLASVAAGAPPAIRLYRWRSACLSLGRNQVALGVYDPDRAARAGIDVVRRPTGGLAVLHDDEITYSVTVPVRALGGPRAAYRRIHEAIAAGLARLGVPARLAGAATAVPVLPGAAAPACFAVPMGGEVLAGGGKLVGSAQRTERRTILQHGAILLSGNQARVASLRADALDEVDGSVALADLLDPVPAPARVAAALRRGFAEGLGIDPVTATLTPAEQRLAGQLETKYRDDAWTWRR